MTDTDNNIPDTPSPDQELREPLDSQGIEEEQEPQPQEPSQVQPDELGRPLLVAAIAVALLIALSLVPWSQLTDHKVKDYNLISDLMPSAIDSIVGGDEFVDPELLALMGSDSAFVEQENQIMSLEHPSDVGVNLYNNDNSDQNQANKNARATVASATGGQPAIAANNGQPVADSKSPRVDGKMIIEDYTPSGQGLRNLKAAIAKRGSRPVRIGVIGDSYIEGDIFTSDIRQQMQDKYGGRGVGYMAANSQVAGYRPTVKQTSSGWTQHGVQQASKSNYFTIAGEYYTGSNGATIRFNGVKNKGHVDAWNRSELVFIAPASGTITLETDSGSQTYDVTSSDAVQSIVLDGETSSLKVTNHVPGLILLGAWLQDSNGVVVDCMSIRGDSGINRRGVNAPLASQLRQFIDYDLIVVEYGINALTSKQHDYSKYGNTMTEVVNHLKQCYPNADIILMGIGDRGQKINGEAQSFATAANMIEAQRNAARKAGVMFYDTRESMGGDGAVVKWRNQKLVNGDYIHLNFQGGKVLATTFVDALTRKLSE